MQETIIKSIIINSLQYNAQRDPQAYRRVAGQPFRIRVGVGGNSRVHVTLTDERGAMLAAGEVAAPGTFSHELTFAQPGVRIVTVTAQHPGRNESRDLRLDVMAQAWVG